MFDFFKRKNKNDLHDKNGKVIEKSSIAYDDNNVRYLKLSNDSCAIVLHPNNNVEVIFTKDYNNEFQTITENEEQLMALALFMKQPGFLEMIVDEFKKLAVDQIKDLTKDEDK